MKVFLDEQAKSKTEIVDIERWFETSIGEVKLRGRIDRIDKDGPNYTVVDYKTSKKAPSLNELKKDMQLLVYALAVRGMYGDGGKLKVEIGFCALMRKCFFNPNKKPSKLCKQKSPTWLLRLRLHRLNLRREAGNALNATTVAYATFDP